MFFLLLFAVSLCTRERNITPYLGRHGVHVRVAVCIITDTIFSVFFNNVCSQVFSNGLIYISE